MNRQTKLIGGAVALLAIIGGYVWYKSKQKQSNPTISGSTGSGTATGTASGSGNSGSGSAIPAGQPAGGQSNIKLVTQTRPIPASMGKAGALNQKDSGQGLTTPAKNTNNPATKSYGYNPTTYGGIAGGYNPITYGNEYGNNPTYGYEGGGWAGGGTTYGGFHYGNGGLISG